MTMNFKRNLLGLAWLVLSATAAAHGDVTPQTVDTRTLPPLGAQCLPSNPYGGGPELSEALRIGSSAYNQNCARCHGLEAIFGGLASDLRKIDEDCNSLADDSRKKACFADIDGYFAASFGLVLLGLPGLADHGWPIGLAVKSKHQALAWALEASLQQLRDKGKLLNIYCNCGITLMAT